MVSDRPLPDRCGARVTDKVGLEVQLDTDRMRPTASATGTDGNANGDDDADEAVADATRVASLTDDDIAAVRLHAPDSATTIDGPPNYKSIREYLWDDYELTHGAIPAGGPVREELTATDDGALSIVDDLGAPSMQTGDVVDADADTHVWVELAEHVEKVTNARSELQGFCERYPMNDPDTERCYNHKGGGAPEGNTNAMTHGLYAQRTNFYQSLDESDQEFVEAMADSWIKQAPFDRDNIGKVDQVYRIAIDQLRAWSGVDEFVEGSTPQGLVTDQEVFDGEEVHEVTQEHPANLPYSRLDNDIQSKLKDLGIYGDDPESKQADATESLAQMLSGSSDN